MAYVVGLELQSCAEIVMSILRHGKSLHYIARFSCSDVMCMMRPWLCIPIRTFMFCRANHDFCQENIGKEP